MKGTKTLLYAAALAVLTLVSTAHAQIAFRSSSSAFIAGGGGTPVAPGLRSSAWASIKPGATRFYPQTPAPTVTPTIRGSWPDGGTTCCASGSTVGNNYQPLTLETFHAPPGTAQVCTAVNRIRPTVNPGHVIVTRMISGPLPVDQTISGTMNLVIATYESANNQNAFFQFHVYVLRAPDTVVGTLMSNYAEASTSGNEWPTSSVGKGPAGGTAKALSSVAALAGDRIVIESGWVGYSASAAYGDNCLGAHEGGDATIGGPYINNGVGWIEFSQDLFGSRIAKPTGTVAGDVMIA